MIRNIMAPALAACLLSITSTAAAQEDFAFGFHPGMQPNEIRGVESLGDRVYSTDTAPNPHSGMESYMLLFCGEQGLQKVVGIGKNIEENGYGIGLKQRMGQYRAALNQKYGNSKDYDFLISGALWDDSNEFLMSLRMDERTLTSYWDADEHSVLPDAITAISLTANGLSSTKGYLTVTYEFNGHAECQGRKTEKDNDAF